jgi:hypothetical protein
MFVKEFLEILNVTRFISKTDLVKLLVDDET